MQLSNDGRDNRSIIAYILSATGGAIIGWQLGQELAGRPDVDWFPAVVGVGLIVQSVPVLQGDHFALSVRAVHGDYAMDEMKSRLTQSFPQADEIDVPYTVTDNFPSYIGYELSFGGAINKWFIGTKVGFRTTGGRFGYKDQTGETSYENLLTMVEITEFVRYRFISSDKFNVSLGVNIGAGKITEKRKSTISLVSGYNESSSAKGTSLNLILGPELQCSYSLTTNLQIDAMAGYDQHIATALNTNINADYFYAGDTDWTGTRYGVGINWIFNTK